MNERVPAAIMARPRRLSGTGPVMATRLTARAQQIVHRLIALTAVGAVSFLLCTPAISQAVTSTSSADAVGQFYKGKQITFVVGAAVGGGYDTLARLARHWESTSPATHISLSRTFRLRIAWSPPTISTTSCQRTGPTSDC